VLMYRLILSLFIVLSIISCQKDPIEVVEEIPLQDDITAELTPFFRSFQQAASDYGLDVDYGAARVTAEIVSIDEGSVAGTCTTNGRDLRHIAIDQSFWNRSSTLLREMVVFHELGHCILGRGHEEGQFDNGICRSIMRSGLGSCSDAYTPQNRAYFIEELFSQLE